MRTENEIFRLCDLIRETSFSLHQYLRHGHLEKVYENGLAHRLKGADLKVEQQYPLQVLDEDETVLGDFIADLYVENCLIIELKACKSIISDHTAQLLGYLRASRIEHGILINFGAPKLEIKKYVLSNSD
ncbi:MAG: GxxExxY protein [Candidatus Brocadiaceae bacterium]|nr:GxxExxY protein [Candidatus Brocadiaceae bacterium]